MTTTVQETTTAPSYDNHLEQAVDMMNDFFHTVWPGKGRDQLHRKWSKKVRQFTARRASMVSKGCSFNELTTDVFDSNGALSGSFKCRVSIFSFWHV